MRQYSKQAACYICGDDLNFPGFPSRLCHDKCESAFFGARTRDYELDDLDFRYCDLLISMAEELNANSAR